LVQVSIAASSRSTARRARTCALQPLRRNSNDIPDRLEEIPNNRLTTATIRARVHR
jgi:hypothetical protein